LDDFGKRFEDGMVEDGSHVVLDRNIGQSLICQFVSYPLLNISFNVYVIITLDRDTLLVVSRQSVDFMDEYLEMYGGIHCQCSGDSEVEFIQRLVVLILVSEKDPLSTMLLEHR
jgi:hypothetical protein